MILDIRIEAFEQPVGQLRREASGAVAFRYAPAHLEHRDALPISLALPLRLDPFSDYETRAYFANLLPENDLLPRVMESEGLDRNDVAGLLFHLGADCPGAVSCLPAGSQPAKVPGRIDSDYDFLAPEQIADIARRLADNQPLPHEARDPSPLAGVQRKIALVATPDGRYALPKRGSRVPTTHILKVPARADAREADLEAAAAGIAARCGLNVAAPVLIDIDGARGLLLRRFDRRIDAEGGVRRLHQEDFAQALGLPPSLKYERNGKPPRIFNLAAVVRVLSSCAAPALARARFLEATFFNLAIGNADNHAKNHALLYNAGAAPNLAPLYDLLPIMLNHRYTHQLAFRIGAADFADKLTGDDFRSLFAAFGLAENAAKRFVARSVQPLLARLDGACANGFVAQKDFADLINTRLRRLAEALGLDLALSERDFHAPRAGGWDGSWSAVK